ADATVGRAVRREKILSRGGRRRASWAGRSAEDRYLGKVEVASSKGQGGTRPARRISPGPLFPGEDNVGMCRALRPTRTLALYTGPGLGAERGGRHPREDRGRGGSLSSPRSHAEEVARGLRDLPAGPREAARDRSVGHFGLRVGAPGEPRRRLHPALRGQPARARQPE